MIIRMMITDRTEKIRLVIDGNEISVESEECEGLDRVGVG